jgi:hypothetical protein
MSPRFAALAGVVLGLAALPAASLAQQWNDARTIALVDLAIARRTAQLADTGLADYRADAHGYLTFLAQLGEGFPDPPKVVRADELAVEVFWRAPNQSKQRLVGRRDTLLLPTDINYHRDHLAIVQNNFPSIIRLGDGDEVRDVPHPLSAAGRDAYDFAVADSLTIRTNDRVFDVLMVKVRPKDDRQPRAVGAVYLDRANGSVVRMTFSFTRAALLDAQLEDVSVVLDNGLVEGRFWLPRRQEIEIRRTGTWMDFPARGIIRGRWEICCVTVNNRLNPAFFAGEEIVAAPLAEQRRYPFKGGILEGLPGDVKLSENDDVRRVQEEARSLVRAGALARTRLTAPAARSVSDLVRMNRNEGIAVGGGVARRFGAGVSAAARLRFGTGDHEFKETVALGWQQASGAGVSFTWRDDYREAGDESEVSGVRNTIASQEFGADFTDYYRARGAAVQVDAGVVLGTRWRLALGRERQDPLAVRARPASGRFAAAFPAEPLAASRVEIEAQRGETAGPFGASWRAFGTVLVSQARFADGARTGTDATFGRFAFAAEVERAAGDDRLVLRASAAATAGAVVPRQSAVFFGGPQTAPGYDFHQLGTNAGASGRIEWRHHAFSFPMPLGRFGPVPVAVTIAPYAAFAWTDHPLPGLETRGGWFPSAGVGALTLFDVLRFDVARGLRGGRWTFSVDLSRDLWRIL